VPNAMLRTYNGQLIQTLCHGVRFPAILMQHSVQVKVSRKTARNFKPTRERDGFV
jgi:hypothetical protein